MNDGLISIIVPVLNEESAVRPQLELLQPLRQQGHELIVVDGGSQDRSLEFSRSLADKTCISAPGRGQQLNLGASFASHAVLLFLHIDTELPDGAAELIRLALERRQWGRFDISLSGEAWLLRIIERCINWRSCLSGVATGDQAMFVTRSLFEKVGRFEAISLLEDVSLSKRLREYSWPARVKSAAQTSSRRWEEYGIIRTVFFMWRLRAAFFLGASPEKLVEQYYPHWKEQTAFPYPRACIAMFAREPRAGKVKTRLIPALGAEGASKLHTWLVNRQINTLQRGALCRCELWIEGDAGHNIFNVSHFFVNEQCQGSLGERMRHSVETILSYSDRIILIGSDCPQLDEGYLQQALQALEEVDLVIGPAEDGGYVLIGLRAVAPSLFDEIEWGTDVVLEQTLNKAKALSLSYYLLPTLSDIDIPADLEVLESEGLSWRNEKGEIE